MRGNRSRLWWHGTTSLYVYSTNRRYSTTVCSSQQRRCAPMKPELPSPFALSTRAWAQAPAHVTSPVVWRRKLTWPAATTVAPRVACVTPNRKVLNHRVRRATFRVLVTNKDATQQVTYTEGVGLNVILHLATHRCTHIAGSLPHSATTWRV